LSLKFLENNIGVGTINNTNLKLTANLFTTSTFLEKSQQPPQIYSVQDSGPLGCFLPQHLQPVINERNSGKVQNVMVDSKVCDWPLSEIGVQCCGTQQQDGNSHRSKLIKIEGNKCSGATLEPQNVLADAK
jgi:hypothetical protein